MTEKEMADWQKRAVEKNQKLHEELDKDPEKYGVTREHLERVKKQLVKKEGK